MSDQDIALKLKIETAYDGKGSADAEKGINNLDKKQSKLNETSKETGKASLSAKAGFSAVGAAASATAGGGIGSMSSAMGQMLGQIKSVASFAGTGGLLLGAFAAWKSAIEAVLESQAALEKNTASIQRGNATANIDSQTAAYKKLIKELAEVAAETERLYNIQSGNDAKKREELASLELWSAQQRSNLDPSDKFASQRLELDVSKKRTTIENAATNRQSAADDTKIDRDVQTQKTKLNAALIQQTTLYDQSVKLQRELQTNFTRINQEANAWWRLLPVQSEEVWKANQSLIDQIKTDITKVKGEYESAQTEQKSSAAQISNLEAAKDLARRNRNITDITGTAQDQTFRNTSRNINYDQRSQLQAQRDSAQQKYSALTKTQGKLQETSLKEEGDVRRAKNTNADLKVIEKEAAEATKAFQAVKEFLKENASTMRSLQSEMRTAKEAMRNLPNN